MYISLTNCPTMKLIAVLQLCLFLSLCGQASAQQTIVGVNAGDDATYSKLTTEINQFVGVGVSAERRFDTHSGIETGIYYQRYSFDIGGNQAYHFLSVPVLYKFYSHILNFSLGPVVTRYLGSSTIDGKAFFEPSLATDPSYQSFGFGYMAKLSKSFSAGRYWIIEPEFRFTRNFTYQATGGGVGLAAKYRL